MGNIIKQLKSVKFFDNRRALQITDEFTTNKQLAYTIFKKYLFSRL